MGESARPVIEEALAALGVETRLGVEVASINPMGITLESGEELRAATVVWCAGMRANPLTRLFPVELDRFGRIPVDEFMRVKGLANVFAAGDVACAVMDDRHASVMSCQHGRPMGRFAGNNVVCDLLSLPLLPLHIDWYVTVLDLGSWGAVYTEGWDRHVVTKGETAKKTKQVINGQRIYPPLTRNRMLDPRRRGAGGSEAPGSLSLTRGGSRRPVPADRHRRCGLRRGHPRGFGTLRSLVPSRVSAPRRVPAPPRTCGGKRRSSVRGLSDPVLGQLEDVLGHPVRAGAADEEGDVVAHCALALRRVEEAARDGLRGREVQLGEAVPRVAA